MDLNTLNGCQNFVEFQSAETIAAQLRKDQEISRKSNGFPSLLVYCLPLLSSQKSRDIAHALSCHEESDPDTHEQHIPLMVSKMRYAGIVRVIKSYLATMEPQNDPVNGKSVPAHQLIPPQLIPTEDEFHAALKVLQYLQLPPATNLDVSTSLEEVVATIQAQLSLGPAARSAQLFTPSQSTTRTTQANRGRKQKRTRVCYICHFCLTASHPLYPSLCPPCGNFNIASSSLSLPPHLNLLAKTALITGARVHLGFHTALRLLRCGARVIASTRYPHDAEVRYILEPDSHTWKHRLRIVGADFRTAKDVFALVDAVKECLQGWGTEKLDVLINNAAQTLTDSVNLEKEAIEQEEQLRRTQGNGYIVMDVGYSPRVRGGVQGTIGSERATGILVENETEAKLDDTTALIKPVKSSWTQKLHDIPYEDVISAHSINTFVPLILLRELLPIMSLPPSSPVRPTAYVINVSSREGIPEIRPAHPSKAGYHVHTNMSKAALNMLTETEAGEAWRTTRVAINSVDPGYMSADTEWMQIVGISEGDSCPIGWEDGAARVLWAVAMGEKGEPIWGRFLKHFRPIDVRRL